MHKRPLYSKLKLLLLTCLVATLIIASQYLNIQQILHNLVLQVNSLGYLGPIAFIVIYNLATLLFIPGWKIVLLTRLSPIFPFNLLNYAFGVTQVSLKDYILGSIGIIPGTLMYVYIGSLASNIAMLNTPHQPTNPQAQIGEWVIQVMGCIATIAVTIYITKIAQKALKQNVAIAPINHDTNNHN